VGEWRQQHIDVFENLRSEDRDPRLIQIQQLWVFLEVHKRERADGDIRAADDALQEAKKIYDNLVAKHPHFPPHLRTRLDSLKREMEALLPH
jgi:hypothetical protein